MAKTLQDDGSLAVTVRADPANADKVRAKFGNKFGDKFGGGQAHSH
jgi:hypothetical protein